MLSVTDVQQKWLHGTTAGEDENSNFEELFLINLFI